MNTKRAVWWLGWIVPLAMACEREPGLGPDQPSGTREQQVAVIAQAPSYTTLDGAAARGTGGSLRLAVNAGGEVPRFPDAFINSVPVFGYAWVDLATGVGVVATIHPLIGRDSNQNPRAWHAHQVQLSAGAAFDFCIASLGTSQGGLTLQADELGLNVALHQAGVSAEALDVAAAFVVQPDAGCVATGLGVDVLDASMLA
jgi:hypothetical protein